MRLRLVSFSARSFHSETGWLSMADARGVADPTIGMVQMRPGESILSSPLPVKFLELVTQFARSAASAKGTFRCPPPESVRNKSHDTDLIECRAASEEIHRTVLADSSPDIQRRFRPLPVNPFGATKFSTAPTVEIFSRRRQAGASLAPVYVEPCGVR